MTNDPATKFERDFLYTERARVAVALARGCRQMGCAVGFGYDAAEPDWPVLFIELPIGQVSWHLSPHARATLAADIADDSAWRWDGHTTDEKYRRLDEWSRSLVP